MRYWLVLLVFLTACASNATLEFSVAETGDILNGIVMLDDAILGNTTNGKLIIPRDQLHPGEMSLIGEYAGRQFAYEFIVTDSASAELKVPLNEISKYQFTFLIDNQEPINGDVFINSKYLGHTQNGELAASIDTLFPGTITFNGTHNNGTFAFEYPFPKEALALHGSALNVPRNELALQTFNAAALDTKKIAKLVFDLVNVERQYKDIPLYHWDPELASVANLRARARLDDSSTIATRLDEAHIYRYAHSENAFATERLGTGINEHKVAEAILKEWNTNPADKAQLIDDYEGYTHVGVGIFCDSERCYAVLDLARRSFTFDDMLNSNSCYPLPLYEEDLPFSFPAKVNVAVQAEPRIDIYLYDGNVESACNDFNGPNQLGAWRDTGKLNETFDIQKGRALLLVTRDESETALQLDYSVE